MSVMQCQRILQMISPLKPLDRFTPNFTEMFFESTKVRRIQFYVELNVCRMEIEWEKSLINNSKA